MTVSPAVAVRTTRLFSRLCHERMVSELHPRHVKQPPTGTPSPWASRCPRHFGPGDQGDQGDYVKASDTLVWGIDTSASWIGYCADGVASFDLSQVSHTPRMIGGLCVCARNAIYFKTQPRLD